MPQQPENDHLLNAGAARSPITPPTGFPVTGPEHGPVTSTGIDDDLPEEQLSMVLAHEFAHVQRRDVLTAFYMFLCQTVFFFNPATWIARREWQIARESACDQIAMERTGASCRDYADMLIKVSVGARRAPAFALSAVPAY